MTHSKKLMIALAGASLILLISHELKLYLPDLETWIQGMGIFAPLGFVTLFAVLTPFFVSVDALCFAAGMLFPILTGELAVIFSTYLSATVIYYLGQDLMRERVQTLIDQHQRLAQLDKAITGDNAFKLMFLLRLTPLPFAMLSYTLSVIGVKFWPYLAATTGILVYNSTLVYLGYTAKHLTGLIGTTTKGFISFPLLMTGLLLLVGVLVYMAKVADDTVKGLSMDKSE